MYSSNVIYKINEIESLINKARKNELSEHDISDMCVQLSIYKDLLQKKLDMTEVNIE